MKGEFGFIDVQPIPRDIPGPGEWITPGITNGDWGG